MVYWLIGISGSGKTTLGLKLLSYLKDNNKRVYMIDGDEIRDFFDNDLGYTKSDRVANIKRIILAAYLLDKNDVITIVCNISPFEDLRLFCKQKINNYRQIYLKKNLNKSMESDVKKMYSKNYGTTSLVGVDIAFEEPLANDLVIETDELSLDDSFNKIIDFVKQDISL